ncbi:MAG TPA: BNR-4 repeat-containing protein [Polyangiaceae bacterium]|nr:BNR-4 repeat-containing protein [Polyangiaceae bacterium]
MLRPIRPLLRGLPFVGALIGGVVALVVQACSTSAPSDPGLDPTSRVDASTGGSGGASTTDVSQDTGKVEASVGGASGRDGEGGGSGAAPDDGGRPPDSTTGADGAGGPVADSASDGLRESGSDSASDGLRESGSDSVSDGPSGRDVPSESASDAASDGPPREAGPSGAPIVLTDEGGWCWFESSRALFYGDYLIVGSVASGFRDAARRGDIEAIVHDVRSGQTRVIELHDRLDLDDHDSPAWLVRPDGRLLTMYARHGTENHFYYRISEPNDPLTWGAEQTFVPTQATLLTYSNLYLLSSEGNRIYDFYRGLDNSYKPSYAFSDDLGQTWRSGNIVINVPSTATLQRPYVRYAFNGRDTVHLVYTEAHPRDYDNSLYHIFYRDGALHHSDGVAIHTLTEGLSRPDEGTRIYQGDSQHVAWGVDVALDAAERPIAVYSVQMNSAGLPTGQGGEDIRYRYARWDGAQWRDYPLAFAGSRLYAGEDDYSGLAALDPANPSIVYISTNADPVLGTPLVSTTDGRRHYEIFRGITRDEGATWEWLGLTQGSTVDNLRPIVPPPGNGGQKVLLWLRGQYRAYTDYQQEVVALFYRD